MQAGQSRPWMISACLVIIDEHAVYMINSVHVYPYLGRSRFYIVYNFAALLHYIVLWCFF
jgi:hypothetical protein